MLLPRTSGARAPLVRAWDEALIVRGPGGVTARHAHHWWHLVVGLEETLSTDALDGAQRRGPAILTPPDVAHAITAEGEVAILFIEPESRAGASLAAAWTEPSIRLLSDREAEPLADALCREPTENVVAMLLAALGASAPPPSHTHPAITKILRHLQQAPADADVSLDALASLTGLSTSRFMHAFTQHVGLPLRPYIRWLRVRRAAEALLGGTSASEAAHDAGFADAAHMTRTFREMFGVTPTDLARRSQSVQSP